MKNLVCSFKNFFENDFITNFMICSIVLNVVCDYYYSFSVLVLNNPINYDIALFSLIVLVLNFFLLRIIDKINKIINDFCDLWQISY